MTRWRWLAAASLLLCAPAWAEGRYVIRVASAAPEGSTWAREFKAFSSEVARATNGEVQFKWYLGSVAGDEREVLSRIDKQQLDGSAGIVCELLSPSMKIMALPGVFQNRDEAAYVVHQLRPRFEAELRERGYTLLNTSGMGSTVIFTRRPVSSLGELRRTKLWLWDVDETGITMMREMGMSVAPMALWDAGKSYDEGKIDAFNAIPAAALAFQWASRVPYVVDLRTRYLTACLVVTTSAFDRLPIEHQRAVRTATAKLDERIEETHRKMDETLLGSVFERAGVKQVPVSSTFRLEFFEAARSVRERVGPKLVPGEFIAQVLRMLADYRVARAKQGQR